MYYNAVMPVDILWTTAFIDMGVDTFETATEFWCAATGSTQSERRGDSSQFATLLPADGDASVRVQRTDDGSCGIHLDLHVASPTAATAEAVLLGATIIADHGYAIMRSPGGYVFCFVEHHGESAIPSPVGDPPRRLDQVCIDIPPQLFEQESMFWSELTGWDPVQSQLDEFRSFPQPAEHPLRFLLQRLDEAPAGGTVHAHLDIACGDDIGAVASQHVALGAKQGAMTKVWMQMTDPAGLSYCLTPRET
jgi:hypothetical protein